jgi:hypothetical protein
MNIRLTVFGRLSPLFIRKKKLHDLFRLTARAFGTDVPAIMDTSYNECLREYRAFTTGESEKCLFRGDAGNTKDALYKNARAFAEEIRHSLRPKSMIEIMEAARLLYDALGIDFRGDAAGRITVRKCFFSQTYSPRTCELMSSLDHGIMAGLAGGGELRFSQRLTEGRECCLAEFILKDGEK